MRDDDRSLFLAQSEKKNHNLVNHNYDIKSQNYEVIIMMEKYDILSQNYETKGQNDVKPSQKVKDLCDYRHLIFNSGVRQPIQC